MNHIRRIAIVGAVFLMPALSAISPSTASATKCFKVVPTVKINTTIKSLYGNFAESACSMSQPEGPWVLAETWGFSIWSVRSITNKEVCTQANSSGTGFWENYTCTFPLEGGPPALHKWTLVYAVPQWLILTGGISVVKGKSIDNQTFGLSGKVITCKSASGEREESTAKVEAVAMKLTYGECEASGHAATISGAEYEFEADDTLGITAKGTVITIPSLGCSVKLQAGGSDTSLGQVIYSEGTVKGTTKDTTAVAIMSVKGIHATSSGGECGTGETTNNAYSGELEFSAEGDSVSVELEPSP
jgi:hypothetical protein